MEWRVRPFTEKWQSMVFRSHRLRILVRILLICLIMAFSFYAVGQGEWYVASGVSIMIVIVLVVELFRFIDRSNRDFINLLKSMKYEDFAIAYSRRYPEKSFRELESAIRDIQSHYRDTRRDREVQYQYLQMVVDHVRPALVSFREDGSIYLFNKSAEELFLRPRPDSLVSLSEIYPDLHTSLLRIKAGQSDLVRINRDGEMLQLALTATEFVLGIDRYKLVSLQDIGQELEQQELDSWQKLIRVLTHEIMNSVTPVSSLSTAVNEMLISEKGKRRNIEGLSVGDMKDLYSSLGTIEERSRGLLKFVGDYKNLTRLPKPCFEDLDVERLLDHVRHLFKNETERLNIVFGTSITVKNLGICADRQMIQQVLINLVKNAIEAVKELREKEIILSAFRERNRTCIAVRDNGAGIDPDNVDKVFIPFFTTREKGSGIGLSLSRQIMRLHRGNISFRTGAEGTTFTLVF